MMIRDRLEHEGFEVESAEDGETGLSKSRAWNPDCIILDVMLPKLDGFRVARLLKFDPKYRAIPILMLTARSQESDQRLGKEMGADEYLIKPVEMNVLVDAVRELVERVAVGRAIGT
jgi:two-component system alkaline phosphatase synthesis response regulator PhoP/two-component system response regulator VicR